MDNRQALLNQWATAIDRAARAGALTNDPNKPISIKTIDPIAGPRAGALHLEAGLDAGRLLNVLSAHDCAMLRQFITWPFSGEPACYMFGRAVRIEAGWSDELAERDIRLADLNKRPYRSGQWAAGKSETGSTVNLSLSDEAAHFGVFGATGSGKSVCLRSMVSQLSQRGDQLVLIDGKYGAGLRDLDHLSGVIGPLAKDIDAARGALAWAVAEMTRRYEQSDTHAPRLVTVIDEVQEFANDPAITEMIRKLTAQGREVHVSCVLATQNPVASAFGDASIKRNVTGRIALRVSDYKASEVAVGQSTPRADWLLGSGDAFCIKPGTIHRTQIAYMPASDVQRLLTSQPMLSEWQPFNAEALPNNPNEATYSGAELAVSLVNAYSGHGRPALVKALESAGLGKPGNVRAERLLKLGREQLTALRDDGWDLCPSDDDDSLPA